MTRTEEQFKGDAGENFIRNRYIDMGYRCTKEKPNNKGYDFFAYKRLNNGTFEEIFIEVKAGKHKLSKSQQRMKKETEDQGKIYKHIVIEVPEIYFSRAMRTLWPDGFLE